MKILLAYNFIGHKSNRLGVSNTPLSAMALASQDLTTAACSNEPIYAKLVEILDSANWYDGVTMLAIAGGNFALNTGNSPKTLVVYALRTNGDAPFIAPNSGLDFTSGTTAACTVGLHSGVVTRVAGGTSVINVAITAVPTVTAECTATVT